MTILSTLTTQTRWHTTQKSVYVWQRAKTPTNNCSMFYTNYKLLYPTFTYSTKWKFKVCYRHDQSRRVTTSLFRHTRELLAQPNTGNEFTKFRQHILNNVQITFLYYNFSWNQLNLSNLLLWSFFACQTYWTILDVWLC